MSWSLLELVVVCSVGLAADPPPPQDAPRTISLGVGWTVAQARALEAAPIGPVPAAQGNHATRGDEPPARSARVAQNPREPEPPPTTAAPRSVRPNVRPYAYHSDLDDRIRERRIARGLYIGAAIAVQTGMLIYGITEAVARARENEQIRDEPPRSQYNPMHPR